MFKLASVSLMLCLVVVLKGADFGRNQDKIEHSSKCPNECKTCDAAVAKALKFVVSYNYEKDNIYERIYNIGMKGLALLASGSTTKSGPHQKEINETIKIITKQLEGNTWQIDPATMFLAHIYQTDKSAEVKKTLEKARDILTRDQVDDGGWAYRSPMKGKGMSATFFTNTSLVALLTLKHVGIDVDEKVLEKARGFYTKRGKEDGSYGYNYLNEKINIPKGGKGSDCSVVTSQQDVGRTMLAAWVMQLLGLCGSEKNKKAKEYVDKRFDELDISLDGPSYHLFWGALTSYYGDEKGWWKKYNDTYRDLLLKSQKEDGGIFYIPDSKRDGYKFLNIWDGWKNQCLASHTTPQYIVVLQLHKGHLMFGKFKQDTK